MVAASGDPGVVNAGGPVHTQLARPLKAEGGSPLRASLHYLECRSHLDSCERNEDLHRSNLACSRV